MNALKKVSNYFLKVMYLSRVQNRFMGSCSSQCAVEEEACLRDRFLYSIIENPPTGPNKVSIIGAGQVGMACAFGLLAQNISNEICIIDKNITKAAAEMSDLQHGSILLHDAKITAGDDYCLTANSRVCIITIGVPGIKGATRLDYVLPNTELIKSVVPMFVDSSPNGILIMVTNPVDVMTYVAWKASGLEMSRVIGSGCALDTCRFKFFLSELLNVPPSACHGWIIGEHGESCVPVWSGVDIAGVRLRDLDPKIGLKEDDVGFHKVLERVVKAADEIIAGKGYTSWAVGLNCAAITKAILENNNTVIPVSTSIKGLYGIDKEIFLSMPCTINANGVTAIVKQSLTNYEIDMLKKSAKILYDVQLKTKM